VVLSLRMAESEGTVSPDELVEQIKNLRRSAWACARPPVTEKEAQEKYVHDRLRQLTVDLIQRGVTVAMLEGTFMVWWLRLVCVQRFDEGGFELCIAHIGRVMHPIPQILERVYDEIEDAGPMPEMKELGDKVDSLKSHAGAWLSWPKSRDIAGAEQDVAFARIQPLLGEFLDQGIQPVVLESALFYFWFRCTALRRNLHEWFFQKLERNWDAVMERVNRYLTELPESLAEVGDHPRK
jgi:hypothetical protein